MDDRLLALEREYCPPLDNALYFAIASDYDLLEPTSIPKLRATLDDVKQNAELEEATDFDPSGSSALFADASSHESASRAQSWHGDEVSKSIDTDLTSISQSLESLDINSLTKSEADHQSEWLGDEYDVGLEELSVPDKEELLREMFPSSKPFDISYAFGKAGHNFGRTVEELLNQVFVQEAQAADGEEIIPKKGIDAFVDDTKQSRGCNGRGKRKKQDKPDRRSSSTPTPLAERSTNSPVSPSFSGLSKWDQAKKDVEYITKRTYLTPQTVSYLYHKSGASLPATISALCTIEPVQNPNLIDSNEPTILSNAAELSHDFPAIPAVRLMSLVLLTHPSTASAHELANAMSSMPTCSPISGSIQVIPVYAPPDLSPSSPPAMPSSSTHLSHPSAVALATTYTRARNIAFSRASAAYRISRSQPLMGGAASYYSQVGRDAHASAVAYNAAASNALVDAQSNASQLDLHGVNVKDAVRIVRERVETWWEERKEWARAGKVGESLRIVVGAGRHSTDGRGRLGPAVGGMLAREGWRVEVGTGVLVVNGRTRGR